MKKRIWIITLFPEHFFPLLECGVVGQAFRGERSVDGNHHELMMVNPRDYAINKYKSVDDYPFGGGAGMVMRADVMERALLEGVVAAGEYGENWREKLTVIFPCPRGKQWSQEHAKELAQHELSFDYPKDLVLICGRYEGIDERFLELYVDDYISLGDFILSGGELAVMTILDAAMRLVPGVLGNKASSQDESFEGGLLEHPQYTRPREFHDLEIPEALISGHHKRIAEFQQSQKEQMTQKYRPDLMEGRS
jgi:tRNA (guanine37-N1)-methyltransferase